MTQSSSESTGDLVGMTEHDMELLRKLEEENRRIEHDSKSPANTAQCNSSSSRSPELHHKSLRKDSISSHSSTITTDSEENGSNELTVWNSIISNWSLCIKKKPHWIKEIIRVGVPDDFRSLVWLCFAKADTSKAKEKYVNYLKMTSPCEKVIRRDISRTYPEHKLFAEKDGAGQEGLFNVIKAYSLFDREVGYCQGIAFIVGLFLMRMPEEDAFAMLVSIMHDYSMREMYKPDMFHLGLCIYQLECMVQEFLPELYRHFQAEKISTSAYASSWFLTLFTTQFSLNVACRVMDLFLSEGIEFIFRIAIALLETHEEELMFLSMDDMLKYFQKEVPARHENDHESLFQRAFSVQYNGKKMKKLEKEYLVIRKEEQEDQVEIRRLRNENRLLKQRVENLEKESETLANRLIEGQVLNAQRAEESYQLERENRTLKKQLEEYNNTQTKIPGDDKQNSSNSTNDATNNPKELENLRDTIDRLVSENRNLRSAPNIEIASLQEELTLVKMRDAEAQVSINELRQRIADLNHEWQSHCTTCKIISEKNNSTDPNLNNDAYDLIAHELLTMKMREAELDCDNKLLSQKLMDCETQRQILYNQIKRQDEEIQRVRYEAEQSRTRENELRTQLNEITNQLRDGDLKKKEDSMMLRIREVESAQMIADLRQRIAELEVQNQELITRGQIMDDRDLQEKFTELQDEVMRLRLLQAIHHKQVPPIESNRLDYEGSDDGSITSPVPLSPSVNHRSSTSSNILFPTSFVSTNSRLRQSTPSLFPSFSSSQPTNS